MEISKKDLLQVTGISYGQLYRWKREGLIPEAWFVKRSSYTGQETYFPKDKILKRIKAIQQLKDTYSLEELASMLTPEVSNRVFNVDDLEKFEEIHLDVATCFMDEMGKDDFKFNEVLLMIALSQCKREFTLSNETLQKLAHSLILALHSMENIDQMLILMQLQEEYYMSVMLEGTHIYFDDRLHIVKEIHLQEISNAMKIKYKTTFQFEFEEEEMK